MPLFFYSHNKYNNCPLIFSLCRVAEAAPTDHTLQPGTFELQAPIYDPQKLICVGLNYIDHCTEQNVPVPKEPVIFNKFASTITEPNGFILLSDETKVGAKFKRFN